jgi:hypothetical protein
MIAISNCENAILNIFRVENFSNDDEIKRHIFPIEVNIKATHFLQSSEICTANYCHYWGWLPHKS